MPIAADCADPLKSCRAAKSASKCPRGELGCSYVAEHAVSGAVWVDPRVVAGGNPAVGLSTTPGHLSDSVP